MFKKLWNAYLELCKNIDIAILHHADFYKINSKGFKDDKK